MEYSIKTVEPLPNQLRHDKLAAGRALISLTSVLLFLLASPATAQIKEWDPGLPKDLFKSGPPGRLRDARCKACEDAMAKLQAALDDWYAMELSDGERLKKAGTTNPDFKEGSEQQKNGKAEIEDAIAGLGQPGDKGKAAQKKQQENSAKDAKENANKGKNAREILKAKIAKLRDELTNCEKTKCKEEEAPSTPTPTPQVVVPGGAPGQPKPPPPPNITIPPPPADACFKDQAEKDAYLDKLDAQRRPIFDKWFVDRKEANEDGATQAARDKFAQSDANLRAIDAAIQAAGAMGLCSTPTPKPGGGGKATGPGKGKPKAPPKVRTGGNVSLPEGNFYALISENKIKVETSGTGETIGHIADLKIENVTDDSINCVIPPMVLESRSRKNQDYACPQTENITIDSHQTEVVPIDGVCVNRHKPPVGKDISGDLVVNTGDPTIPQNPDSHMSANQARDLLRICTSKYHAADKLQKDGDLKDLPYKDKQKQKDIVVQWSTWSDPRISEITGAPPATREDLKKVVYQQLQTNKPMSPETRKKADQGIDTIFEKVELTTAKAKELEKPDTYAQTEMPSGSFEISDQVSDETGSPAPKTQEKPKKTKKEKKDKGPPGEWSKPILDWWWKLVDADRADLKKRIAKDDYEKQRNDFFKKSKYHEELVKKINEKQGALDYWGPKDTEKLIKERDELKKELGKLEGELEKDFQKTDEGKKALTAKGDAQKAAADAAKAEQEAGKYLDKETIEEKAFEELKKWAREKALKEVREGSSAVHE